MTNEQEVRRRAKAALTSDEAMNAAMRRAGQHAFQYHAWTRTKLWIWRDGRVAELDPNDPNAELPEGFERPPPGPPPWVGL